MFKIPKTVIKKDENYHSDLWAGNPILLEEFDVDSLREFGKAGGEVFRAHDDKIYVNFAVKPDGNPYEVANERYIDAENISDYWKIITIYPGLRTEKLVSNTLIKLKYRRD